ncbi:putative signal transducing protein [Caulobacter sp. LARHSG274]
MSLTEIARFADLTEAQIAASRLRADGVPVLLQNEYWGTSDYMMSIAMGGFRLWTPASQAAEARALIAELRAARPEPDPDLEDDAPSDPAPIAGVARTGLALFLAALLGGPAGWLAVAPLRRVGGTRQAVLAGAAGALAATCGLAAVAMLAAWLAAGWSASAP